MIILNIEDEIFKMAIVDFQKLKTYGFIKDEDNYIYTRKFMNDSFRADIIINKDGKVDGKIYDLELGEEYISFRFQNQIGDFVNKVRVEYKGILFDILEKCFKKKNFISEQANRIFEKIFEMYGDNPEHLFEKSKDFYSSVFRNPTNDKWYSLIMNIDKCKIGAGEGKVDVLNVKLDEKKIVSLLGKEGYYLCYHMNKKSWITIILDDTLTDEKIMEHIAESHQFTERFKEWIIPANPKYYDIINCFNNTDIIIWKQSSKVCVGDIIYLYVAEPYSAILYKCVALEVDIPYNYKDNNLTINNTMKIKLLERYDKDKYIFRKLNEYGVRAIRGPRNVPKELSEIFNK